MGNTIQPQNWLNPPAPVPTTSGGLSPGQLGLFNLGQTNSAPTTAPVTTTPTVAAPTTTTTAQTPTSGTSSGLSGLFNVDPNFIPTSAPVAPTMTTTSTPTTSQSGPNFGINNPREVTPSPYQVGLYRHMIFRLLQQDDPDLMTKLQARVNPNALSNALVYLGQNQADALSSPLLNTAFNDDHARMVQVLDDLGAWLNELDRRQRIKMGVTGASAVEANAREAEARKKLIITGSVLASLLLIAGVIFVIYRIRSSRK